MANLRSGRPKLLLHGKAAEYAAMLEVKAISLSMTHTAELAQALVIFES